MLQCNLSAPCGGDGLRGGRLDALGEVRAAHGCMWPWFVVARRIGEALVAVVAAWTFAGWVCVAPFSASRAMRYCQSLPRFFSSGMVLRTNPSKHCFSPSL
ncbi:hypothetical protein PC119_g22183 [Phytophthora cactorum]|nr:hypothetical protein PC119_g22183 [Phytophthora cactorum]